jgi:hypothetical protein
MKKDTKALLDRLGNVNSGASLEQWIAQSSAAMAALMTVVYGENGTSGLIGKVDSLARQSDAEALVLKNLTTQFATLAETDATLQAAISQLSSRLEKHVTDNDLHTEELKLLKMALQQALKAVSTNPSSTTLPVTPEFNAAAATLLGLLSELETLGTEMLPLFMQIQQDSLAALLNGTAAATCKLDGAPLTDIGLMLGRIESVGPLLKTLPALADLHTHTLTCDGVAYTVIVPF